MKLISIIDTQLIYSINTIFRLLIDEITSIFNIANCSSVLSVNIRKRYRICFIVSNLSYRKGWATLTKIWIVEPNVYSCIRIYLFLINCARNILVLQKSLRIIWPIIRIFWIRWYNRSVTFGNILIGIDYVNLVLVEIRRNGSNGYFSKLILIWGLNNHRFSLFRDWIITVKFAIYGNLISWSIIIANYIYWNIFFRCLKILIWRLFDYVDVGSIRNLIALNFVLIYKLLQFNPSRPLSEIVSQH